LKNKTLKQLERDIKNSYIRIMVATTEDKKKYKLTHKQVDKTVDSPCIQICTYDEEEEFCIGVLDVIELNKNYKIGGL